MLNVAMLGVAFFIVMLTVITPFLTRSNDETLLPGSVKIPVEIVIFESVQGHVQDLEKVSTRG